MNSDYLFYFLMFVLVQGLCGAVSATVLSTWSKRRPREGPLGTRIPESGDFALCMVAPGETLPCKKYPRRPIDFGKYPPGMFWALILISGPVGWACAIWIAFRSRFGSDGGSAIATTPAVPSSAEGTMP